MDRTPRIPLVRVVEPTAPLVREVVGGEFEFEVEVDVEVEFEFEGDNVEVHEQE